jgi:superfamily I DNA/RNA helicase
MEWSQYQRDVFAEAARLTDQHCAVVARAGSGKTTSLIESLHHVPYHRVLLCAFNKSIQTEMENRAPRHVLCRTLHSLGLRLHQQNLRANGRGPAEVVPEKAREQAMKLLEEKPQYYRATAGQALPDDFGRKIEAATNLRRVAAFAKNVLAHKHEELVAIASQFDLQCREDEEKIARAAGELLDRAADDYRRVDFDDMSWFPWVFEYGVADATHMLRYDVVLVDERQDTSPAQDWMIQQMCRDGRCFSYLDPRQTIYGFRGVDRQTVERVVDEAAVQLPLPVSYRCPLAVIEKARLVVPDIEPRPDAPDGRAVLTEYLEMLDNARAGDFILSRTNAPLMSTCLRLLQQGMPATVAGRDIGESLRKMLKKSRARSMSDLFRWLQAWLTKEYKRHMPEHPRRYETSQDKAACLDAVARFCTTPREVDETLQRMFSDVEPKDLIVCSTVHKAKGLERDRVWMLSKTFGYPHLKPWQDAWSEENIWYVAVTRSKDELFFVETDLEDMGTRSAVQTRKQRQVKWR